MADDSTYKIVSDVAKSLNNPYIPPLPLNPRECEILRIGDLVAAKIKFPVRVLDLDEIYHRARVTEILKIRGDRQIQTRVRLFFVVSWDEMVSGECYVFMICSQRLEWTLWADGSSKSSVS